MEKQILKLIEKEPFISSAKIAEIIGYSKYYVVKKLKSLNINRDISKLREYNNPITRSNPEIVLSSESYQVILGSILGDGNITKWIRNEKSRNSNSYLSIKHSINQKEYLLYKKDLLESSLKCYLQKERNDISFIDNRKIEGKSIVLNTEHNIIFNNFRNNWYPNDLKIVNLEIDNLNELGLAIWYMDDGNKHSEGGCYFHTENFNEKDCNKLIDVLSNNFNIQSKIHKVRGLNSLYVSKKEFLKLKDIILPYICNSMNYKLGSL